MEIYFDSSKHSIFFILIKAHGRGIGIVPKYADRVTLRVTLFRLLHANEQCMLVCVALRSMSTL